MRQFKAFGLTEESDEDDYAPYGSKDDGDEEEAGDASAQCQRLINEAAMSD